MRVRGFAYRSFLFASQSCRAKVAISRYGNALAIRGLPYSIHRLPFACKRSCKRALFVDATNKEALSLGIAASDIIL